MQRRAFLKQTTGFAAGALLSASSRPAPAAWMAEHFANDDFERLLNHLVAEPSIVDSDKISLQLPQIAENGAEVPITISSELSGIERIYLWVEKNPTPLTAKFQLSPAIAPYVGARIKMAESCHVTVLAQQGEQWLRARQWVKVMQGGCGTG